MTTQPGYPSPDPTSTPLPPSEHLLLPTDPPKRRSRWPWILAAAAILLVIMITVVVTAAAMSPTTPAAKATPTATSAWDAEQTAKAAPTPTGELGVATPAPAAGLTAADVTLRVKIKSQKCYGYGVGCSIEYEVQATWPSELIADGDSYDVTYEVSGVQDGPQTNTLTIISADQYEHQTTEFADTTKRVKTLKAKVTDVEKTGI